MACNCKEIRAELIKAIRNIQLREAAGAAKRGVKEMARPVTARFSARRR